MFPPTLILLLIHNMILGTRASKNLQIDYFMTSETEFINARCCKNDANTDITVLYPESLKSDNSQFSVNFTINRNHLRHTLEKSLCSAELRLYQYGQSSRSGQRVESLLLQGNRVVLDSKQIGKNSRGWKSFNVYEGFNDQHHSNTEIVGRNKIRLGFQIRPHSSENQKGLVPQFRATVVGEHKPRIFLKSCRQSKRKIKEPFYDATRTNLNNPSYYADQRYWSQQPEDTGKCGLRILYLQFVRDMDIANIKGPDGLYVNYCAGSCPYLWKMDGSPTHTMVLGNYAEHMREPMYQPCCVPSTYESAKAITEDNEIVLFEDIIVTSCKCV